jgi:hypothetical protein
MPAVWKWADQQAYMIGAILILMGVFLLQFGGKHYLTSIFMINTFGMMCLILCLLFGIVMPTVTP